MLSWVAAAPLTSRTRFAPTMVELDPRTDGVPQRSIANLDEIQPLRPSWLDEFVVRLRPEKMQEVERAIHFALALTSGCPTPRYGAN